MSTKLYPANTTVRPTSDPGPGSAGEEAAELSSDSPERPSPGFGDNLGEAASPDPTPGGDQPPCRRLPWRSTGCTRRLVTVSQRAMISSLSSMPSKFRQPSDSKWLSPDILSPKKGTEDVATNVSPSRPAGRPAPWQQTPEVPFQAIASAGRVSDIPAPLGGSASSETQRGNVIRTYDSGLYWSRVPQFAL